MREVSITGSTIIPGGYIVTGKYNGRKVDIVITDGEISEKMLKYKNCGNCKRCRGRGIISGSGCKNCNGTGITNVDVLIEVAQDVFRASVGTERSLKWQA